MSRQATRDERQRVTDLYRELYKAVDDILVNTQYEDKWAWEYERILMGLQKIESKIEDIDRYS